MKHNYLDNYELVNGYALIDTDFSIITANEKMYKFLGAVRKAAISDAIHQVDIDDFINVSNNLRIGQSKSMVLRMKRVDNSYRWVLMDIKRLYMSNNHKKEYLELNISDVIGLKNHTNHLNEDIGIYRRVLSINDKLVYTYEYDKDLFTIYNYVNDDAIAVISSTIDDVYERILKKGLIPNESIKEYTAYFNNIKNAKSVYDHHFSINVNYGDGLKPTGSYINGSTIYAQRKPIRSVGTLKLPDANNVFSKTTYDYEDCNKMLGREGLEKYTLNNISYNKNYRFAFIKVHIDNITEYKDTHGKKAYNTILDIIKETLLKVVEYRGVAGNPDNETEYVVIVKNLYNESELRAFIEYMRSRIIWECKAFDVSFMPLFSIGIGRYPDNGTDFKVITDKLIKATDIAISKGGNRYIIYKEDIHGEL